MSYGKPPKDKKNRLFQWTLGERNIVLNLHRDPKGEFSLYGDAYHDAGKKLLKAYEASGGYSARVNSFETLQGGIY